VNKRVRVINKLKIRVKEFGRESKSKKVKRE